MTAFSCGRNSLFDGVKELESLSDSEVTLVHETYFIEGKTSGGKDFGSGFLNIEKDDSLVTFDRMVIHLDSGDEISYYIQSYEKGIPGLIKNANESLRLSGSGTYGSGFSFLVFENKSKKLSIQFVNKNHK